MQPSIVNLAQSVIDSIKNISVASVKELKKFLSETTLNVEVKNPQEKVEVTGEVTVNQEGIERQLKNIALSIRELRKPLISSKEQEVWEVNDVEKKSETLSCYGEEAGKKWRIRMVKFSAGVTSTRYATVKNNSSVKKYEVAWENREKLKYGYAGGI